MFKDLEPDRRRSAHRASRRQWKPSILSILGILSVSGFVAVPLAGPSSTMAAAAWFESTSSDTVNLLVSGQGGDFEREAFSVSGGWGIAPAAGRPNVGSSQAIALDMVLARGWDQEQFSCLSALWAKESGWNEFALNRSSGAYGIPQSLPGEKMASAGADWATNPATQIRWGLGYIEARYGVPCAAWGHSQQKNWY